MNADLPESSLWFLARGALPVRSDSGRPPKDVTHWCREGDEKWTSIEIDRPAWGRVGGPAGGEG